MVHLVSACWCMSSNGSSGYFSGSFEEGKWKATLVGVFVREGTPRSEGGLAAGATFVFGAQWSKGSTLTTRSQGDYYIVRN